MPKVPRTKKSASAQVKKQIPADKLSVVKDVSTGHIHSSVLPFGEAVALLAQLKAKHEKETPGRAFQLEVVEI